MQCVPTLTAGAATVMCGISSVCAPTTSGTGTCTETACFYARASGGGVASSLTHLSGFTSHAVTGLSTAVVNAYGGRFLAPTGATNNVGLYADSINCGILPSGASTTGQLRTTTFQMTTGAATNTVLQCTSGTTGAGAWTATPTLTNLNLAAPFTFNSSLAAAAATVTTTWAGMTGTAPTATLKLSRFGYQVLLWIVNFNYSSTSAQDTNPNATITSASNWVPNANSVFPATVRSAGAFVSGSVTVSTAGVVTIGGLGGSTVTVNTTTGVSCFVGDYHIGWNMNF
jgi:flagellin